MRVLILSVLALVSTLAQAAAAERCQELHPEWAVVYDSEENTLWVDPDLIKNHRYSQSKAWTFDSGLLFWDSASFTLYARGNEGESSSPVLQLLGEATAAQGSCFRIKLNQDLVVTEKTKWATDKCLILSCSEENKMYFLEFTLPLANDWWVQTLRLKVVQ
ncbi:hypothetical protein K2X30_02500 [bacterium]|nr:hypothetical protein [bacterium]